MQSSFYVVMIGAWFLFMVLAIVNAIVRNLVYRPYFGDLVAHQISTFVFIGLILLTTFLVFSISKIELSDSGALLMGGIWLVATILFEFVVGHFVFGNSWDQLLADYNIFVGRIWVLVLISTFVAPYFIHKIV